MLYSALMLATIMTPKTKASSQNRVKKALESLQAARTLQRDRQIWGVGRVNHYIEDVDGDWLDKWGEEEEELASKASQ